MIRLLLVLKILHAVVVGLMTTHGVSSPYQMIDQCCWLCHVMINCQVHSYLQSHVLDQTAAVVVVSLFAFPGLWLYADGWMSIGVMSWQPISLISISMYIFKKTKTYHSVLSILYCSLELTSSHCMSFSSFGPFLSVFVIFSCGSKRMTLSM